MARQQSVRSPLGEIPLPPCETLYVGVDIGKNRRWHRPCVPHLHCVAGQPAPQLTHVYSMVALGRSRAILPGGPQRHHLPTTLDQRCQLLFLRSRQRAGYADLALQVQDLWLKRQRQEAVALIPDKLVLKTHLLGTPAMVRERLRVHHQAGVTTLRVVTEGETLDECLMTLSQLLELVKEVNAEPEHQRIS